MTFVTLWLFSYTVGGTEDVAAIFIYISGLHSSPHDNMDNIDIGQHRHKFQAHIYQLMTKMQKKRGEKCDESLEWKKGNHDGDRSVILKLIVLLII